jgi:hypothetical protein
MVYSAVSKTSSPGYQFAEFSPPIPKRKNTNPLSDSQSLPTPVLCFLLPSPNAVQTGSLLRLHRHGVW